MARVNGIKPISVPSIASQKPMISRLFLGVLVFRKPFIAEAVISVLENVVDA